MSEEVGDQEFEEVADVIPVMKVVECPECKNMVPYSMYCTCCEYPLHTIEDRVDGIEDERLDAMDDGIDRIEDGSVDFEEIIRVDTRLDVKNAEQHPSEPSIQFENVDEDFDKADFRSNFEFEMEVLPEPQITGELDLEEGGEMDDSYDEEEDESVGIHEVMPSDVFSDEPTSASVSGDEEDPTFDFSLNQSILELNGDILNCISLKLWSVNLLFEGKVDEAQFNELYGGYCTRFQLGMDRRKALLKQTQDIETFERLLNQARVGLEELEMRKSLDDLYHGEYEAKAPAYIWDIQHHIDRAYARSVEIAYLKDLTKVVSADDIAGMKEMTEKLLFDLDNLEFTENVSNETLACVRRSLEEIIAFIEE